MIGPVALVRKRIVKDSGFEQNDLDDPLGEHLMHRWKQWRTDILKLQNINISRFVKPIGFGNIVTWEIHHFSVASMTGYGSCSYLRLVNEKDRVHCSLLMGKARVVLRKPMTISRLELLLL